MKKFQRFFTSFLLITFAFTNIFWIWITHAANNNKEKDEKITICHNWTQTLSLSKKAIQAHLDHWDIIWECWTILTETWTTINNDDKWKINENTWTKNCEWVDENGRSKQEWHKDVIDWKKLDLYKKCSYVKYDLSNPHPWCKNIEKIYEKKDLKINPKLKLNIPYWLTKKYNNCSSYWTPYPQYLPSEWFEDFEAKFTATWSIKINSDTLFTETQNVVLSLSPSISPTYMRFSEDSITWTEFEIFQSTRDYLIKNNTIWEKTIFVQYKIWDTISNSEYDKIMLLPKYGAEYNITNKQELPRIYEKWKTYIFQISVKNTWFLTWENQNLDYPVQLRYLLETKDWEIIDSTWNFWILKEKVEYWKTIQIPILVRIPENLESSDITVKFDLEEWWVSKFRDMWVKPLSYDMQVENWSINPRPIIKNKTNLSFGIWEYTSLENQSIPDVVTVCEPSENLYELSDDKTVFTVRYSVPFGRSIHTPHIYDLWVDSDDKTTAFYELDYNEYISSNSRFYLYKDSVETSELCAIEQAEFPNARPCETLYTDLSSISNTLCLDIAKATNKDWESGYIEWTFRPNDSMNRAEFSKLVSQAWKLALYTYSWGINDIDSGMWFAHYVETVLKNNLMSLDQNNNFRPNDTVKFSESVATTLKMFWFNINNSCDYNIIYPWDPYIWAGLFYGIIWKNDIPLSPSVNSVTRAWAVSMMVVAQTQEQKLKNPNPICPNSVDDTYTKQENYKQICWTNEEVRLSSSIDLTKDLNIIPNWTPVEIRQEMWDVVKIYDTISKIEWYVSSWSLTDVCDIPTPLENLKTPVWNEVLVSTPVGIYAYILPSITSNYFDYDKNGIADNKDIIPYNSILKVIESKWNWFKIQLQDGRTARIYNWFVEIWPDVPLEQKISNKNATISWAHGMTVDLRNTPFVSRDNIIYEVYEWATVQIIEEDKNNPFVFVKIESVSKNLSDETLKLNYSNLYSNLSDVTLLNKYTSWISGRIHRDFLKEINKTYEAPFVYPFDYTALWETNEKLVSQIFFEEVFQDTSLHDGIDYNLPANTLVLSSANWTIQTIWQDYVIVNHSDLSKTTYYGHINPKQWLQVWQTLVWWEEIWTVQEKPNTWSQKAHLHFSIYDLDKNWDLYKAYNPSKYIWNYNMLDAHVCAQKLVIDQALRDWKKIEKQCEVGVGSPYDLYAWCTIDNQSECINNALSNAEKIAKLNIIKKITPQVNDLVNDIFNKLSPEWVKKLIEKLQNKSKSLSWNAEIIAELIVIQLKVWLANQEYKEWMQDILSLNNLYDIAVNIWAWYAIWELTNVLIDKLIAKYGKTMAAKLWAKAIPYVWRWLAWYAIATAWTENIRYLSYCYGNTNVDWKTPSYYCWALTANWILILWWIGISHANSIGWFKIRDIVNNNTRINDLWDIITEIKTSNFISRIKISDNLLIIKEVFKWKEEWFSMSDIILWQLNYVNKNSNNIEIILLDNIVNKELKDAIINKWEQYVIDNWWNISWLDGMSRKLLENMWKTINEIRFFTELIDWIKTYSIRLTIK